MIQVANYFFDLLQKYPSLYLKLQRDSSIMSISSGEGRIYLDDDSTYQQIIGERVIDVVPEQVAHHFTEAIFRTINLQAISSLTLNQALHPKMPFSLKFQVVPINNQSVGLVVSSFKDDQSSTGFYERIPVMILYLDKEEKVIWANEHFTKKSKFEKEDVIGKYVRDFLRINTRKIQIDALRAKESHIRTEYKLHGRKRTKLDIIASAVEQCDDEGNFLCTTVVLRDVSEAKAAQTELEYQKKALDESAIVAVTDVRGDIIYVNDRFCEISQYNRDELMGQNHRIIKSDVHPPEVFEDMWATIYEGNVWSGEVCNKKKDGSTYWVNTTIIPFLNERGKPFRYQAIRFEISERKALEKQLQKYNQDLEKIVEERTEELQQQTENLYATNRELSIKNDVLDKQNLEIRQSINYAKRIQDAILPSATALPSFIKDHFVLYKPKDIVSGDFYWWYVNTQTKCLTIAAVDCTGHGVPGAFMSMIGSTLLDEIVKTNHSQSPSEILNQMRIEVGEILQQNTTNNRDGMDMSVVTIDYGAKKLYFSGAKNGLLIIRKEQQEAEYIRGDRMSIGGRIIKSDPFTEHEFDTSPKMKFYLSSDGYQDQFGGENGQEKFMSKRLKQIIYNNSSLPMPAQKEILMKRHLDWKKDYSQIDDILVMGFEIS